MARRRKHREDEDHSYWLSYSDMMAGLLLMFVVVISFTMMQAKRQYEADAQALAKQQLTLDKQQQTLVSQQKELEEKESTVAEQEKQLEEQQKTVDEQEKQLKEQQKTADEQAKKLEEQQKTADEQARQLKEQEKQLKEQQKTADEQAKQLEEQQKTADEQAKQLEEQQKTADEQAKQLEAQQKTADEQAKQLEEQEKQLEAQQKTADEQARQLEEQQKELDAQKSTVEDQQKQLDAQKSQIEAQQKQMEDLIGIRTELVEELKEAFSGTATVTVDSKTGAIMFDSNVLFDYSEDELTEDGEDFLLDFLPQYFDVLLSDEFSSYLSEIIIEGHTDTDGSYLYNLELSQRRALAVAEFCLDDESGVLNYDEIMKLRNIVTANGRSYSDPILYEDGDINMDASRRVEIKFRLKEEEMVEQMMEILNGE